MENDLIVTVRMPPPELGRAAQTFLKLAEAYELDDASMKAMVVSDIQKIQAQWDAIEEMRKRIKKPIDEAAKQVQLAFVPTQEVLMKAKDILRRKLDRFIDGEIREQKRLQEVARKAAEEQAKELAKAAAVEASAGRVEVARAMEMEAQMLPAAAALAVPDVGKTTGTARKEIWSAVCEDKRALVQAAAGLDRILAMLEELAGRTFTAEQMRGMLQQIIKSARTVDTVVPLESLLVNDSFLNAQARALKSELRYPGVKVSQAFASSIRR